MGLRTTMQGRVSEVLEQVIATLVDEVLTARALVHRAELDDLATKVHALHDDVIRQQSAVEALKQAIDAFHLDLPDDLVDDLDDDADAAITRATRTQADQRATLKRLEGALDATQAQIGTLLARAEDARARAEQAHQVATTARATAEAAADGVTELEFATR